MDVICQECGTLSGESSRAIRPILDYCVWRKIHVGALDYAERIFLFLWTNFDELAIGKWNLCGCGMRGRNVCFFITCSQIYLLSFQSHAFIHRRTLKPSVNQNRLKNEHCKKPLRPPGYQTLICIIAGTTRWVRSNERRMAKNRFIFRTINNGAHKTLLVCNIDGR